MSFAAVFKAALDGAVRVEQLTGDEKAQALAMTRMFDACVAFLSAQSNEVLQALGDRLWSTIHQRVVQVAIWPAVATVTFTVVRQRGVLQGMILLPSDWIERVEKDCVNELGAVVFVGSQAVAYGLGELVDNLQGGMTRARAHEAEYLHMVHRIDPQHVFSDYHRQVMQAFPQGLRSL